MKMKSLLMVVGIFLGILFNSIIYGALNTDMFIDGDAYVRVDRDIRVTDIKVIEQVGGAYETYNCNYSKDTTNIQVTLPSSDSSIVYEVTITNKGNVDSEVKNIMEESYSNSNIKYELLELEKGTIIARNTVYKFKVKLTTNIDNLQNTGIIVLKYNFIEVSKEWLFDYTGGEQEFKAPYNGTYKLEVWGGGPSLGGGAGGYSVGNVSLSLGSSLFIVVGEGPNNSIGGYNGGGNGNGGLNTWVTGGGGATHISTTNRGLLQNYENFKNEVLIVAAGGGGGTRGNGNGLAYGGIGGGLVGGNGGGHHYGSGATQTAGGIKAYQSATDNAGSFGRGSDADPLYSVNYTRYYGGGGGSGWYGGSGGSWNRNPESAGGGGGGSSFIDNVNNGITIAGDSTMPTHDGLGTMIGNVGNGYAKITLIEKK